MQQHIIHNITNRRTFPQNNTKNTKTKKTQTQEKQSKKQKNNQCYTLHFSVFS